jgi:hypothetical protein
MHTTPTGYRQNEKQNMYNNEEKIKKIVGVEESNHKRNSCQRMNIANSKTPQRKSR